MELLLIHTESRSQAVPPTWAPTQPGRGRGWLPLLLLTMTPDALSYPKLVCSGVKASANNSQMGCFRTGAQ